MRGGHRPEFAVELLVIDVLRLVDFEQKARGMADDVRGGLGGEEELAGAAEADGGRPSLRGDLPMSHALRCGPKGARMLMRAWGSNVGAHLMPSTASRALLLSRR